MQTLYKLVIKWLANFKGADGKFTLDDIERVAGWVVEQDKLDAPGLKKAEVVVGLFNQKWQNRAAWIATTVVQLCYALVQIRNLNK